MVTVNNDAFRGVGGRSNISGVGGSVALSWGQWVVQRYACDGHQCAYRASAANVSMIKFNHNNCTALNTLSLELLYMAVTTVRHTAVIFTVS